MMPGDVTFYVDAAGIRHPAVVSTVNDDGTVNLAVLKVNQGRIPVSAEPAVGHAWDPTLPASNRGDVEDQPAQSGVIDGPGQDAAGLGFGNEGDSQLQESPGPEQPDSSSER